VNKSELIDAIAESADISRARPGRNPQTGAEIRIPASKVPGFKAGKALKDAVK